METKAWEKRAEQMGAQQTLVDQWAVSTATALVLAHCVGAGEILAVAAALHRAAAKEIQTGVVVQATVWHGASASSLVETLESDVVAGHQVMHGVTELVRQATPALWVEIREVLRAGELGAEWARGPAA